MKDRCFSMSNVGRPMLNFQVKPPCRVYGTALRDPSCRPAGPLCGLVVKKRQIECPPRQKWALDLDIRHSDNRSIALCFAIDLNFFLLPTTELTTFIITTY